MKSFLKLHVVARFAVAAVFVFYGMLELLMESSCLTAIAPWTQYFTQESTRFIGLVDICGGLGLFVMSLTIMKYKISDWALMGCALKQLVAASFHLIRAEFFVAGLNLLTLALCFYLLDYVFLKNMRAA